MTEAEIIQALESALQIHQAGQLPQAEALYRQVLQADAENPDALHLLGVLSHQQGRIDEALALIGKAVAVEPEVAIYHNNLGAAHVAKNQFSEAIACYRKALELDPQRGDAAFNLARLLVQQGQVDEAIPWYQRAAELLPQLAEAPYNLGLALYSRGRLEEAAAALRQALARRGHFVEALLALGRVMQDGRQFAPATDYYRQAAALWPENASAYAGLGLCLQAQGKADEAAAAFQTIAQLHPSSAEALDQVGAYLAGLSRLEEAQTYVRRSLELKPDFVPAWLHLGSILVASSRMEEAVAAYQQAVRIGPAERMAWAYLGECLRLTGRIDEAVACYQQAIPLHPDHAPFYQSLGGLLEQQGKFSQAEICFRRATELKPDEPQFWHSLGGVLHLLGRHEEGQTAYRKALEMQPESANTHSNLLVSLHYHRGRQDAQAIFAEHQAWARRHAAPLLPANPVFDNDPTPDRPLRIGYVSANFRHGAIGAFIEPVLLAHDLSFTTYCYSDVAAPDKLTRRLESQVDVWRDISRLDHQRVAEMIRQDRIDILIDLAGHAGPNRLFVFARKPAPVQVTYLGYPDTTGLAAVDYRLTDAYADVPGKTEQYHTEQLVRLVPCAWCYTPPKNSPLVRTLPAATAGFVTFACFNNLMKLSSEALELMAQVLRAVPVSRLLLKNAGLQDAGVQDRLRDRFAHMGITPDRLDLRRFEPSFTAHLDLYNQVDIALDTYPAHGTATTCDALWMGVPVVTLAGEACASRVGVSLLSNVGLPELIAQSPADYARIAADLAGDLPRLTAMRQGLREKMRRSTLADTEGFTQDLEAEYSRMWEKWCQQRRPRGGA